MHLECHHTSKLFNLLDFGLNFKLLTNTQKNDSKNDLRKNLCAYSM